MSEALQAWFQINHDNYGELIDDLLADAAKAAAIPASKELIKARTSFIEMGIAKGVPVEDLLEAMHGLDARALAEGAAALPDKEGMGWETVTRFADDDLMKCNGQRYSQTGMTAFLNFSPMGNHLAQRSKTISRSIISALRSSMRGKKRAKT